MMYGYLRTEISMSDNSQPAASSLHATDVHSNEPFSYGTLEGFPSLFCEQKCVACKNVPFLNQHIDE
jgi:hypothetical protein